MGANDDREMLEVAKAECVRLERENARLGATIDAVKAWRSGSESEDQWELLDAILTATPTTEAVKLDPEPANTTFVKINYMRPDYAAKLPEKGEN